MLMSNMATWRSSWEDLRGWLTGVGTLLALIATIVGSLVTVFGKERVPWWLGLSVTIVAVCFLGASAWRRWIRPPAKASAEQNLPRGATLVRLRPFENGDRLLGRDREADGLATMVRALEFRFGYLSGEAGAGKTSLLRAGLSALLSETPGWTFVYVPRSGSRPDLEILTRLRELRPEAERADDPFDDVRAILSGRTQPLLVACDQFEEFFLTCRTLEARAPAVANLKMLWNLARERGMLRVLLCLRKEFVDDLLTLAHELPNLRLQDWRLPLSNLPTEVAEREVIEVVAESGELPLSPQLRVRLATDLARDGRVRPVELQVVLTRLKEGQVHDLRAYEERGGARGIVSRFITDTIAPPDRTVPELDRQVARHVLRSLCAADFTARRPGGLTMFELSQRVTEQLRANSGGAVFSSGEIDRAIQRVVGELRVAWILVEEDDVRINLAHDYLAPAVRDATADIETAEERANNLLEQFIAQARFDRRPIPFRMMRYLRRYATREKLGRTEVRALFAWSRRRHAAAAAGSAGLAAVVLYFLLPHGWTNRTIAGIPIDGAVTVSADRRLLGVLKGKQLTLVKLDHEGLPRLSLRTSVLDYKLSPGSDRILVLGTNGTIFEGLAEAGFALQPVVLRSGWNFRVRRERWANFSADGRWTYAVTIDGRVLTWPIGQQPRQIATLSYLGGAFKSIPVAGVTEDVGKRDRMDEPLPPYALMSHRGRFLAVVDGEQVRVMPTEPASVTEQTLPGTSETFAGPIWAFSRNEQRFALVAPDNEVLELSLLAPTRLLTRPFLPSQDEFSFGRYQHIIYSPDSRWLVAREAFSDFYVWKVGAPAVAFPAIDVSRGTTDSYSPAIFDRSGRYVMGFSSDMTMRLWELARPLGRTSKPLLKLDGDDRYGYNSPQQAATFCTIWPGIILSGNDGTLYRAPLATSPTLTSIDRLLPGSARFSRFRNSDELVVYNSNQVATGRCDRDSFSVTPFEATILNISRGKDPRDLLVIHSKGVTTLRRSFMLFGIPVWHHEWPAPDTHPAD